MSAQYRPTNEWSPLIAIKGTESEIKSGQDIEFLFYERMNIFLRVPPGKNPKLFRRFNIPYKKL